MVRLLGGGGACLHPSSTAEVAWPNVWHLFEDGAYASATKKLRLVAIESNLSAIELFRRISRGFELDTTQSVYINALKSATRSRADAGSQATVRRPVS